MTVGQNETWDDDWEWMMGAGSMEQPPSTSMMGWDHFPGREVVAYSVVANEGFPDYMPVVEAYDTAFVTTLPLEPPRFLPHFVNLDGRGP